METMDEEVHQPRATIHRYMAAELEKAASVITPPGGLGCHINVMEFLDHIPQAQYPAGALAAALYIAGVRGMERGTMSEQREPDGGELMANMKLLRLAMPTRIYLVTSAIRHRPHCLVHTATANSSAACAL